jgi:hypothetical protein
MSLLVNEALFMSRYHFLLQVKSKKVQQELPSTDAISKPI